MIQLLVRKRSAEKDLATALEKHLAGDITPHELKQRMEEFVRSGVDPASSRVYADAQSAFDKVVLTSSSLHRIH